MVYGARFLYLPTIQERDKDSISLLPIKRGADGEAQAVCRETLTVDIMQTVR